MRIARVHRLLPVLPLAFSLPAQAPSIHDRIVHEGLENSHVMEFQDYLCHNIGARLTGSDGFAQACEWARSEFEKMGLAARLEPWGEWKLVWNRGQWSGRVVQPIQLELQVATPAWTAGTRGRVKGALVAMPKTEADLEALRPRLGEVYLYGAFPRRGDVVEPLKEALAQQPPLGFVTASRHGMVDRQYENQIRVFGDHHVALRKWESRPTTPEIVVRDDQARQIEELLEAGMDVLVEFDIRNRFRAGPIELHNVVADLVGSEKPDEYVIVCGHLDSWHQAAGATDNGTGTTSTLEAARILTAAGAVPKRTIRFILWGGEEQGLLGSHQYVTRHRQEMDKVSAVLNHDTGTNWAYSLSVTEAMYPDFEKALAPVMALSAPDPDHAGPTFKLRKTQGLGGGFGGSDHASFLSAGVPAWAWGLQGRTEYGYGWHSQWDTYDIVVPEYQRHTATVIALTALGLADLPHLLSREGVQRGGGRSEGLTGLIDKEFGLAIDDGLLVTEVKEGGAAARAGVQKGDKLIALWDRELTELLDVYRAWRGNREEEHVTFTCQRGDARLELKTQRELPAEPVPAEPAPQEKADPAKPGKGSRAAEAPVPPPKPEGAIR